jgi:hypothetical protein
VRRKSLDEISIVKTEGGTSSQRLRSMSGMSSVSNDSKPDCDFRAKTKKRQLQKAIVRKIS